MAIDFAKPVNADAATGVLAQLIQNINSIMTQTIGSGSNIPTGAVRMNPTSGVPEYYNGSTWIKTGFSTAASGGSANVQTISVGAGITAYQDGQFFSFPIGFQNTAACTLNVNSIGAISIYDYKTNAALVGFELIAGTVAEVVYYNTKFYLLNGAPGLVAWNPTITANAPMTITSPGAYNCYWSNLGGKMVKYWGTFNATTATTASAVVILTMPFTINTTIHQNNASLGNCYLFNGFNDIVCSLSLHSSTQLRIMRYDGANHTLAGHTFRFEGSAIIA